MENHFELFQLPQRFAIDMAALDSAYREVQSRVHPDRFAAASSAEKRVAMQWATLANEAYQTLKDPLKRAQYLCELHGVDLQVESNTAMPMAFLAQQMEWREALQEARADQDLAALEQLNLAVRRERMVLLAQVETCLDGGAIAEAAQQVRSLMFLQKFAEEVRHAYDALES